MKIPTFRMPQALTLIVLLTALVAMLTWVVPAGTFERETAGERETVLSGTYHTVPASPQGPLRVLMAPFRGLVEAAEVVAFVLILGGAFGILEKTGAIAGLIKSATVNLAGREWAVIPLSMILFSAGGTLFGMSEETLPFYIIYVPLLKTLGYDAVTGMAVVFLGAGTGVAASTLNPFAVGIAQVLAGIPPGSGFGLRLGAWVVMTGIACVYVMRYAARIKTRRHEPPPPPTETLPSSKRAMAIIIVFGIGMALTAIGVVRMGWYIQEIGGVFTALALIAAFIGNLSERDASRAFLAGASELAPTVLLIGCSRGILTVARDGHIIDTLLNAAAGALAGLPTTSLLAGMLGVQSLIAVLVPSSSGHASLTMPILAPLADLAGVSRQGVVTAFHFASGFANLVTPTSGVLMGALVIADVPLSRWLKFVRPLLLVLFVTGFLFLVLGESVGA